MARYRQVRAGGLIFHSTVTTNRSCTFFARHLTTIENALNTWFDPNAEEVWSEEHKRYETYGESHALYWTWLTENERVLIITCFSRDD